MWRPRTKTLIISVLIIAALLLLTNDRTSQWLIVLLFAGGIPATNWYVPPWIMLIFWAFCGALFISWLGWQASTPIKPKLTRRTATTYYHKAERKKTPPRTSQRTVRRPRSTR